jgi:hypothetical protein
LIAKDRILFGKDHNTIPTLKAYLDEVEFPLRSTIELDAMKGSNDLERLFGTRDAFKYPKPVELIESLLGYAASKDALILDAFAGSGTTAEATLKLNHKDGGSRRFILIEDGEGSDRYGRTLTPERVKRAIKTYDWKAGFTFYQTGKKLDRQAIVSLERDALANLICQADETGRGRGVVRLTGHQYVVGRNHRGEAICLVWNGNTDSEVTPAHLKKAAEEVTKAKLKRPFRIYGTVCRVGDTQSWRFCQIPDEILARMHIRDRPRPSLDVRRASAIRASRSRVSRLGRRSIDGAEVCAEDGFFRGAPGRGVPDGGEAGDQRSAVARRAGRAGVPLGRLRGGVGGQESARGDRGEVAAQRAQGRTARGLAGGGEPGRARRARSAGGNDCG